MTLRPIILVASLALAGAALGGCEKKAADTAAVAQGRAPQGTISDDLPDMALLPNDAPLADPADVPPVPGVTDPTAPERALSSDAPQAAPAPAPLEPAASDSIAE